jgi:Na+/phosphate symporter
MQSTTLAAGLLAGAAGARVLSVTAAACLFVGAQLGAALAPWIFGSITEPRSGLYVIALAGLALGLLRERRDRAVARLLLGAGLVTFGVQVLRPGFEPFASSPFLLGSLDRLSPDGLLGDGAAALLGGLLVAVFQGPSPVLALALSVAETTGHTNLRTTLMLLSGSALGASLGALLTLPVGPHCRRLAQISLLAGGLSTLVSLTCMDGCAWLAARWAALTPHAGLRWGKHVLPDASWEISVAFALSQLVAAAVVVPLLPALPRVLASLRERLTPASARRDAHSVLSGLSSALAAQARALPEIHELAVDGLRARGHAAELALRSAHDALYALLSGPVRLLPRTEAGATLARFALASLQLSRALEEALRAAERLTESRVVESERARPSQPIAAASQATLRQMHALLAEGLESLRLQLARRSSVDADESRAREIEMNLLEAEARRALLDALLASRPLHENLELLALSDAYEVAGNQLFRMADILEHASLSPTLESSSGALSSAHHQRV